MTFFEKHLIAFKIYRLPLLRVRSTNSAQTATQIGQLSLTVPVLKQMSRGPGV